MRTWSIWNCVCLWEGLTRSSLALNLMGSQDDLELLNHLSISQGPELQTCPTTTDLTSVTFDKFSSLPWASVYSSAKWLEWLPLTLIMKSYGNYSCSSAHRSNSWVLERPLLSMPCKSVYKSNLAASACSPLIYMISRALHLCSRLHPDLSSELGVSASFWLPSEDPDLWVNS